MLGFDYRPQLADLPDAKLWRIDPAADYGQLDQAARGRIDTTRITANWAEMLRIAGSIHTGAVSAHDVLRMLTHGGTPTRVGDALAHYGRIFKTLHVLSYVANEPYRRQIKAMRNLQEGRHELARRIFHGRKGHLRQAYREGMENQMGALGLVVNAVTGVEHHLPQRHPGHTPRRRPPHRPRGPSPTLRLHPHPHQLRRALRLHPPQPRQRPPAPPRPQRTRRPVEPRGHSRDTTP
jgi:TnpA family transposase